MTNLIDMAAGGVYTPVDLAILQIVFDDLCIQCGVFANERKSSQLARQVLGLYGQGVRDPVKLRSMLEKRSLGF